MAPGVPVRATARLLLAVSIAALCAPIGVRSQFGGGPGGGFGGGGYNPPAPSCPAFRCEKGEKPVGKLDHKIWSYGCKDSGLSFMNTGTPFDPSNPMKNLQQKSVDKCCVERDICKQTCGMTSKACHDNFQKCSKKVCKGDQNCDMQAMLSEMMSEPYDEESKDTSKKYDPEESKCKGYNRGQKDSCQCVAKDQWQDKTDSKLKAFYGKFNPEKLNADGEIKDLDDVWKKWKGKEADMFLALATKYKEKAVEIRQKPKPPPYTPPPKKDEDDAEAAPQWREKGTDEEPAAPAQDAQPDAEGDAFDRKRRDLEEKKRKAADNEDYDSAQSLKEEMKGLAKKELERLNVLKKKAIEEEDYVAAKAVKSRIAKLEL